jgi:hypothetical protein
MPEPTESTQERSDLLEHNADWLREHLSNIAADFEQDSIAWAAVMHTEFLTPTPIERHEYHNGSGPAFAHLPCRECGRPAEDQVHA